MKTEQEIKDRIIELEEIYDNPKNDRDRSKTLCKIMTLEWVLDFD